ALREVLLELLHRLADVRGQLERVRSRRLEYRDRHGGLVVQETADAIGLRPELDASDVAQTDDLASGTCLDDDVPELLFVGEPAGGVEGDLEYGVVVRRSAELTGGDLDVLLPDRIDDITGRQVADGELLRVEPDAHRVVAAAKYLHVAHSW